MLNKAAIAEVFKKYPLCHGSLIADRGMAIEYCAMGALGKVCGVSDAELRSMDAGGVTLYGQIQVPLLEKFGIESYEQFSNLMRANDKSKSSITRNSEVTKAVETMSIEAATKLFDDAVKEGRLSAERV